MRLDQLLRVIFRAVSRTYFEETIKFSDRLYMRVPNVEITLVSLGIDNLQGMKLSVDEAREIFRSIKRACDLQAVEELKLGELSWKADARVRRDTAKMVIEFNGPLGFTHELVRREDVNAAVNGFAKKFGLQ